MTTCMISVLQYTARVDFVYGGLDNSEHILYTNDLIPMNKDAYCRASDRGVTGVYVNTTRFTNRLPSIC